MTALYIILGIIAAVIIIGVIYSKIYTSKMAEAEKSGKAYKMLEALNKECNFKKFRGNNDRTYHRSTNPQKYKNKDFAFSCFVKDIVLPDISIFEDLLKDVEYNKSLYEYYINAYNNLLPFASNSAERDLCKQRKAQPLLEANITLELYFKYYNEYKYCNYIYSATDIQKAVDEAKRINAEKLMAEKERVKMSDKLRFQVLKRDNYTCQICGRKAKDGVELEIDHIVPIAKGGKTVLSNLQTLCKQCNRGKGAAMMYDNDDDNELFN